MTTELGATWFGAGLSLHARARLAAAATLRDVAADTVLLREGDDTGIFAIITRGRVALRMRVPERGPITILTVEPGDVVGWSAVVAPHRSTSTAVDGRADPAPAPSTRGRCALCASPIRRWPRRSIPVCSRRSAGASAPRGTSCSTSIRSRQSRSRGERSASSRATTSTA